ncbi:MAG: ABC transporter permease [Actinomycetota bacterium]|nr:ABC transporter permease [Actinomycetota bacterium]
MKLRWLVAAPVLFLLATGAVVAWGHGGDPGPGESAVLAGTNLWARAGEHARLSLVSTALAVAVAVPVGVATTRPPLRRLRGAALFMANLGQTVPTVAFLALMFTVTGLGFRTAVLALWAYSLLPVLRNTIAGLSGVEPAVVEAARGMGLSPAQTLFRVELPLARAVIVAGIRTAAVVNVGTAALASFVGAGGLGDIIQVGISNQRDRILVVGATLTAILALSADWAVAAVDAVTSRRLSKLD